MKKENSILEDSKEEKDITLRAIIWGLIIGTVILGLSIHLLAKVGITVLVSPISAFIGLAVLPIIGGKVSKRELNMVQTIASSVETCAYGVAVSFAALVLLGYTVDWKVGIPIILFGSCIGLCYISLFRKQMVEDKTLSFPAAVACKNIIDKAINPPKRDVRLFLIFVAVGSIISALQQMWHLIPELIDFNSFLPQSINLNLYLSGMLLGIGYIVGFEIGIVMLISSLIVNLVIAPIGTSLGWYPAPGIDPTGMTFFNLSLLVGIVLSGSLIPLLKERKAIKKAFSFKKVDLNAEAKAVPVKWLLGIMGICIAAAMILYKTLFNVNPLFIFLAIVAMGITSFISVKVSAQSGIAVGGFLDLFMIFLIVSILGDPVVGILVAAMSIAINGLAGDTMTDLKTGQLVGALPKKQIIGQFIGLIPGTVLAMAMVFSIINTKGVGTLAAPFPFAQMFCGVADAAASGGGMIINYVRISIGVLIGTGAVLFGLPAAAIAVTFIVSPGLLIILALGGMVRKLIDKKWGVEAANFIENGATGLIVGDAIVPVIIVFMSFF